MPSVDGRGVGQPLLERGVQVAEPELAGRAAEGHLRALALAVHANELMGQRRVGNRRPEEYGENGRHDDDDRHDAHLLPHDVILQRRGRLR